MMPVLAAWGAAVALVKIDDRIPLDRSQIILRNCCGGDGGGNLLKIKHKLEGFKD